MRGVYVCMERLMLAKIRGPSETALPKQSFLSMNAQMASLSIFYLVFGMSCIAARGVLWRAES